MLKNPGVTTLPYPKVRTFILVGCATTVQTLSIYNECVNVEDQSINFNNKDLIF